MLLDGGLTALLERLLSLLLGLEAPGRAGVLLEYFERARQRADLVAPLGANDLDIKIALGEPLHLGGHVEERAGNLEKGNPAEQQKGDDQPSQGAGDEDAAGMGGERRSVEPRGLERRAVERDELVDRIDRNLAELGGFADGNGKGLGLLVLQRKLEDACAGLAAVADGGAKDLDKGALIGRFGDRRQPIEGLQDSGADLVIIS